jgi:DNA-binding Lrp family transcriptional regulator
MSLPDNLDYKDLCILEVVINQPSIKSRYIERSTKLNQSTARRRIRRLEQLQLIERRGSPQGYTFYPLPGWNVEEVIAQRRQHQNTHSPTKSDWGLLIKLLPDFLEEQGTLLLRYSDQIRRIISGDDRQQSDRE